jgi:alpha-tubulin suppressor-like RCC1 family protein
MRAAAALALAATAAAVGGAAGCLGAGDFHCRTHDQCGPAGFCETDGHCSVAVTDGSCPSRRRYVENAGPSSGACVPASCAANPAVALAAGGAHACLLRAHGVVQCWGRNDDGQLGDGTTTPRSLAVTVAGIAGGATAVAAGQRHSCAIRRSDGQVLCWGADDTGQLGDGGGDDQPSPIPVAGVTGAVSLAAGDDFSCAGRNDGTVVCWGDDSLGQLGDDGAAATTRLPSPATGLTGVAALSAFWEHACALRSDGSLACWGANGQGQLGDGTTVNQKHPVAVAKLTGVTAVGTGVAHTCAIAGGKLSCWGSDANGQLGDGSAGATPTITAAEVPISDPIAVAVGAQHTCAVTAGGGAIFCWGLAASGQLGTGPIDMLPSPVAVPKLAGGIAIGAGTGFSCALTDDGAVFCWGDNHFGELGAGTGTIQTRPVAVPGVTAAMMVATGAAHTCAATAADDRHPLCWGANQGGQLGDGTATDRASPHAITGDFPGETLAAGGVHSCAVTPAPDGALWCWGRGNAGQLGLGPTRQFDARQPQLVALSGEATAVAAGSAHTCAVVAGAVACFGDNSDGQLGDGSTTDSSTPVSAVLGGGAAPPAAAVAVSAGDAHTCAVTDAGALWCWGRGDEGQLGDGSSAASASLPQAITVGVNGASAVVTAVAAGGAHTCAVTDAGALWCWGRGNEGQLAQSTTDLANRPAVVVAISDATGVAAGSAHTCAVTKDRRVWCWGANESGQLGDGTTVTRSTPAAVDGISDVSGIAAGAAHTCAWRGDGSVWCWGADTSGQLGDGVALTMILPQLSRVSCE